MLKCDLHIHSTFSDGRLKPCEIVKKAKEKNLNYFALTDHDTLNGVDEALKEANLLDIKFIPGVELSTEYNKESIHVLGFFNKEDYKNKELNSFLNTAKEKRIQRAYKIAENLKRFNNIEIDIDKILSTGKDTVARPHIAQAIIDAGYNYTFKEIFDKIIGDNCPSYVPATKMSTEDGVKLLKKYNAKVFLAHPVLIKKSAVQDILNLGFDGLEAIYFRNDSSDTKRFIKLAKQRQLFISCGSDCHGINNDPGHGDIGDMQIHDDEKLISMFDWLKELA